MSEWKVETSEYVPLDLGVEYAAEGAPFSEPRPDLLTEWLNNKAADGWRLIAVDSGIYYFERKARRLRESVPDRPRDTKRSDPARRLASANIRSFEASDARLR